MKRAIILLIAAFTTMLGYAQKKWSSTEFENDFTKYQEITNRYKNLGNKRWAKEILSAFPISADKTIVYQYVIKSDTTYNVEDIHTSLLSWYKQKMPNSIPNSLGSKERLSAMGILQHIGNAVGYMTATYISAREEVTIDIKENRVRITVSILHYISANTWNGSQTVAPGSCYPVISNAGQKDSHAMAFINCHYDALSTVGSLIKYLNENTKILQNGEEDW